MYQRLYSHCKERLLFTESEFLSAPFRAKTIPLVCSYCGKTYHLSKDDIRKVISFRNYNSGNTVLDFCSIACKKLSKLVDTTCSICGTYVTKSKKYLDTHSKVFCSKKCSLVYVASCRKHTKKVSKRKRFCTICGYEYGQCPRTDVCSCGLIRNRSKNLERMGFDLSVIGTRDVILEFDRLKSRIRELYLEKKHSICTLQKMFGIPSERTFYGLFKAFGIQTRSNSESQIVSIEEQRRGVPKNFGQYCKCGYHTTWENKTVYYRSSYELDYCRFLDNKQVCYDMESLRIRYYDTNVGKERIAIPDFYLKDSNTIVEIKGRYSYNRQNMIDKRKAYMELGYDFELIYEHQSYGNDCPDFQKAL